MPRPRRFRPSVESLGAKMLPSSSSSALRLLGPIGALVEDAITPDPLSISGRLRGTAQGHPGLANAGAALDLSGSGRVNTLGPVQFTGTLQGVGSTRPGRAEGTLTLTNAHRTATLRLLGPSQRRGARLPNRFRFVMRGGHEASRSRGVIRVTMGQAPGQAAVMIHSDDGRR